VVLGFSTILAQLVIIREFLNVFEGNELIIGLIFCTWMILTAAGSAAARKIGFAGTRHGMFLQIRILVLAEGLLPFLVIILLYQLESWLFPPGTEKGLTTILLFCFVLLLPGCFTGGMLFTHLAAGISEITGENRVSASYGWESLGSIVAGVGFSMGLAYLLTTFQLLGLLAVINVVTYLYLGKREESSLAASIVVVCLFAVITVVSIHYENKIRSLHFRNQELVLWQDTPYGNISVTSTGGQYIIYSNSTLLLHTQNFYSEEPVHFALLQHNEPRNVMIVSGGLQPMSAQALKYPSVRSVDYVEINPWLLRAEGLFSDTVPDLRVKVIIKDPREHIKRLKDSYDVIIVNAPDPSSAQLNRYFTREFFIEVKNALRDSGVLEISLSATGNYMNEEALELNGMIVETLRQVFRYVTVIAGERNYYLASDNPVGTDIAARVNAAGITNEYVNPYYLDDDLLRRRSEEILTQIRQYESRFNSDLSPLAYFIQIRHWIRKSGTSNITTVFIASVLACLMVLLVFILRKRKVALGVFSSSFAGASAEFLLLFLFQVSFGYVYRMLGVIVACYMGGLMAGSMIRAGGNAKKLKHAYFLVQLVLIVLILAVPAFAYGVVGVNALPQVVIQVMLFTLTATIAFATGLIFNMASKLQATDVRHTAGTLYGIDLAGAAAGTILTSVILLPVTGMLWGCVIIAVLLLVSLISFFITFDYAAYR